MEKFFIVKYTGPFAFIKPWTAVRDDETFSQQFLSPSIIEGIERKLFPELLGHSGIKKIVRHRLSYSQISMQQEVIQTRGWNKKRQGGFYLFERPRAILKRGVLLEPTLHLAFHNKADAEQAFKQHVCLCRNEDLLLPEAIMEIECSEFEDVERFYGFELIFEHTDQSFHVGYNRVTNEPMFGWLHIVGTPVRSI